MIQRVSRARVSVDGAVIGEIPAGLLALIGVRRDDDVSQADRLLERMLGYRVFADAEGRMNRSLRDCGGGLLLVPQFTLAAETRKGTRPGFSTAASPDQAEALFTYLVAQAASMHRPAASGRFGADMAVELVNDGPVTFWLES
nr:D-aminoacyl-tRNA deacylase [Methylonatrum kenyense]